MEGNDMTTYGPASFSLAHRVAVADAVLRVERAELINTSIDEFATEPRELGHFELHITGTLAGEPRDSVRVVVARDRDGSWPIPTDTKLVAFVQSGRPGDEWTLVDNSAFPIEREGFRFSPTAGCGGTRKAGARVTLRELERTIGDVAKERDTSTRQLQEAEPESKHGRWFGAMEAPDATLRSLQRPGRETGGIDSAPKGQSKRRRTRRPR
jgi:hypothetical protein